MRLSERTDTSVDIYPVELAEPLHFTDYKPARSWLDKHGYEIAGWQDYPGRERSEWSMLLKRGRNYGAIYRRKGE